MLLRRRISENAFEEKNKSYVAASIKNWTKTLHEQAVKLLEI